MVYTKPETKLFQVLGVISYGSRQQGEGIFHSDSSLDDLLTQAFQAVFTVRGGQVQQADGVLRWKVNSVCVEKLQEGSVDGVGELADLYDVLLILGPLGAKHGPEMLTPDLQHSFVNMNAFAINAEFEVSCFWTVKLFPQSLRNCEEVIVLWNKAEYNKSPFKKHI